MPSDGERENETDPKRREKRYAVVLRRLFAWLLIPELLLVLGASAMVSLSLKRLALTGIAAFFLLLLAACRIVPEGLLPFRGKWLRRMLAGLAVLGLAYAGPVALIRKLCTYNWTLNQVQQGIERLATYRPQARLPFWLADVDLPRWIAGVPITLVVGLGALVALLQFKLLWDDLGEERSTVPAQEL